MPIPKWEIFRHTAAFGVLLPNARRPTFTLSTNSAFLRASPTLTTAGAGNFTPHLAVLSWGWTGPLFSHGLWPSAPSVGLA